MSPTYLAPNTRYDLVMAAFGGDAHYVTTREQLRDAVRQSLRQTERASLVNVMIDPLAQKKPQVSHKLYLRTCVLSMRYV